MEAGSAASLATGGEEDVQALRKADLARRSPIGVQVLSSFPWLRGRCSNTRTREMHNHNGSMTLGVDRLVLLGQIKRMLVHVLVLYIRTFSRPVRCDFLGRACSNPPELDLLSRLVRDRGGGAWDSSRALWLPM